MRSHITAFVWGFSAVVFAGLSPVNEAGAAASYNVSADVRIDIVGRPVESGLLTVLAPVTREWDREEGGEFPGFVAPPSVTIDTGATNARIVAQSTGRAVNRCVDDEGAIANSANGGEVFFEIVNATDFGWFAEVEFTGFFTATAGVDSDATELASTWFTVSYVGSGLEGEPEGGARQLVSVRDQTRGEPLTTDPKFYDWITTMEFLGAEDRFDILVPPSFTTRTEGDEIIIEIRIWRIGVNVGTEGRAVTIFCDGSSGIIAAFPVTEFERLDPQAILSVERLRAIFEAYYKQKGIFDNVDGGADRLRWQLERAAKRLQKNRYTLACKSLRTVAERTNGIPKPKDWVAGKPLPGFNKLLRQYQIQLGCVPPEPIKKLPPEPTDGQQ